MADSGHGTQLTYLEVRPWIMAKGPEHSMASWDGRLLLKSAHWARESCLSETKFLRRQRQEEQSSETSVSQSEEAGRMAMAEAALPPNHPEPYCSSTLVPRPGPYPGDGPGK